MAEDFTAPTIQKLQPLLEAPQLTPKLLQKPPFRFLFDIVLNVNNKYPHVFNGGMNADLVYDAISGKEDKIAWLTKVFALIGAGAGTAVDCTPKKVVSGSEPEKTNIMLQQLAFLASAPAAAAAPPPPPPPAPTQQDVVLDAPPPPPPPPPPPVQDDAPPPPPPPPPSNSGGKPAGLGMTINVEDLKPAEDNSAEKQAALKDSQRFNERITKYGLDLTSELTTQMIARQIQQMEKETKSREIPPTEKPNWPEEKLIIAIQRQIDTCNQTKELIAENEMLLRELSSLATGAI